MLVRPQLEYASEVWNPYTMKCIQKIKCLISDITQMYSDISACVSTELGPTEWFKTTSGVHQGDTLSPYLFIVLLDYALKKTLQDNVGFVVRKRNGRRHPAIYIGVLAYADDICLLAESIDDIECSLHRLESSAAKIGLTINYNKPRRCTSGKPLSDMSASRIAIP